MNKKLVKYINGELVEYEIRDLVDFYDPILRKPTKPIKLEEMSPSQIIFYIYSMAMMMEHYGDALGLSANQVGWDLRICAINLGKENVVLINPEIIEASPPILSYYEGCVSYPGLFLKIPRSQTIKIKFQTPSGNWQEQQFDGLTAICVQHELDHLDGIVYTQKVSPINLERAKRKIKTNIKKIKKFTKAQLQNQKSLPKEQPVASAPQEPQVIQLPQIIVPEELKVNNPPENFVYKTGNS